MLCGIGVRFNCVCDKMLGGVSATIALEIIGLPGTLTSRRIQHPRKRCGLVPQMIDPLIELVPVFGQSLDDSHSVGRQHMVGLARMRGNSARKNRRIAEQ